MRPERLELPAPGFVNQCSDPTELKTLEPGAPRQNRTAITGLQNQCTAIVLVGQKENSLVTLIVKGEYGLCLAPQRGIEPRTSTLTVSRNYRCATEE